MSTPAAVALITISSLSLIMSTANLAVILFGAKKAKEEVEIIRAKANKTLDNVKTAIAEIEI